MREPVALGDPRLYAGRRKLPRIDFTPDLWTTLRVHPNNPDGYRVSQLIAAIRSALETSTVAEEAERAAEHARQQAEDDERRAELRSLHARVTGR